MISLACGLGGRLTNTAQTPTPSGATIATPAQTSDTPAPQAANVEPTTALPAANRLPIQSVVQIWTLDENDETLWSG